MAKTPLNWAQYRVSLSWSLESFSLFVQSKNRKAKTSAFHFFTFSCFLSSVFSATKQHHRKWDSDKLPGITQVSIAKKTEILLQSDREPLYTEISFGLRDLGGWRRRKSGKSSSSSSVTQKVRKREREKEREKYDAFF